MGDLSVLVQRLLRAPPQRVFDAWTQPELLLQWWGPEGVALLEAVVELEVGGAIELCHSLPDGATLWMRGRFEEVESPHRLVYSWTMGEGPEERVTVRFLEEDSGTRVVVEHVRIQSQQARDSHEAGWLGCLSGLERLLL